MTTKLKAQTKSLEILIRELELAITHAKVAATHFRGNEVPRACAHTLAVEGHVLSAAELLGEIAKLHRLAAKPA
jgi:hypothetical protein